MGALDQLLVRLLPWVPRSIVGRVSSRYIAGESLTQAVDHIKRLNDRGFRVTLDVLGEFVQATSEVERATNEYLEIFKVLAENKLDSQASVKLSQLGLKLDAQVCEDSMRQLIRCAESHNNMVTIDMEDSSCTEETLQVFETLRRQSSRVGIVLQARLRRSPQDVERLLPLEPHVRICKGIYLEPPDLAWQEFQEVRDSYVHLVDQLLTKPSFVAIATHDEYLVEQSIALLQQHHVGKQRYEFQLLLGVREDLGRRLLQQGHPVRIYVPYGAEWYAYSMRRLQENPAIAGHVFRQFFDRN